MRCRLGGRWPPPSPADAACLRDTLLVTSLLGPALRGPGSSGDIGTVVLRLADQIGMTPAGPAENGWRIADVEPAGEPPAVVVVVRPRLSARDRLGVVPDGDVGE